MADKVVRAAGAVLGGLVDAVIEGYEVATPGYGEFPYMPTIEPLPPVDDWLVLGISGAAMILGGVMQNDMLADVGEGMVLYSAPMIVHHTIVRASWMATPAVAVAADSETDPRYRALHRAPIAGYPARAGLRDVIRYGPEQRIITAPRFTPGVLTPKFMLGA